jgi:hypothetical protein
MGPTINLWLKALLLLFKIETAGFRYFETWLYSIVINVVSRDVSYGTIRTAGGPTVPKVNFLVY